MKLELLSSLERGGIVDNRTIEEVRENETELIYEIKQLEQENQKYKVIVDILEFIKARAIAGATQETINKLSINFVNSYIKEGE